MERTYLPRRAVSSPEHTQQLPAAPRGERSCPQLCSRVSGLAHSILRIPYWELKTCTGECAVTPASLRDRQRLRGAVLTMALPGNAGARRRTDEPALAGTFLTPLVSDVQAESSDL